MFKNSDVDWKPKKGIASLLSDAVQAIVICTLSAVAISICAVVIILLVKGVLITFDWAFK